MENGTPEDWFKMAFDAEDPEEKLEYFALILESGSKDPELWNDGAIALVWNNKGISYAFMGMYEDAIKCFERSLSLKRNDTDVLYNLGVALYTMGRSEEAITYYDRILALDPKNDNTWVSKGDILECMGKHNEAIDCYSKVHKGIELDDKFAIVWYKKGLSYLGLGRYDDASNCFSRVLAIDPEHSDAIETLKRTMQKIK
ncbi:tetratricopeptide repeat protein [Methanolobus sp. ZRKC3]|uniref:tetratricopeptide repeat protein n=1 Tax=Methanolobus sp. ZRKC3 TaxID=3125786 RepID=UPI00324BA3CA